MATAIRAEDFEQSIGVNVHVEYTDGKYASTKNVISDLAYLGIDHVRDAALNPSNQGQSSYGALAAAGIKFDMIMMGTNIGATLTLLNSFETKYPGSIFAIEGPNEINNAPITYNGLTGNAAGVADQNALYAAVEADSTLNNLPVYSLTGNTTAGAATDVNVHAYPTSGSQPYATLAYDLAATPGLATAAGAVLTEAGYYTLTDGVGWGGVDEHTQATLTLNLLMDATKLGYSQIDLYQLLDAYSDPNGTNVDAAFGMFDLNNAPKPVAVAIHDLMATLDDTGPAATTFTTGSLNYSITGLPSTGDSLLMEKSNGAYDIVVWNEPKVWNSTTETEVAVTPTTVTVNLGGTFSSVSVYDPLSGTTAIATAQNASSIQVSLTDHPLIIEVSGLESAPQAASTVTSGGFISVGETSAVSQGVTTSSVVGYGGTETVSSNGTVVSTVVSAVGVLNVSSGGVASGTSVLSGGILEVYAGGSASGSMVSAGGAIVLSGGIASATTILRGGSETILGGGSETGATVSSGGVLNVSSGGVTSATIILGGGALKVNSAGSVYGSVLSGGSESIQAGGVDDGGRVTNSGSLTVYSGGVANSTTVLNGASETVLGGGLAAGAVISSGGVLNVSSGGLASGTVGLNGGILQVNSGGTANGTILSGASEGVQAGGVDGGTTISSGGSLNVHSGGIASGTTILNGGSETILSGGNLNGATVLSGGALVISSGATLTAGLALSGGKATLLDAVSTGTNITFATSGGEIVLGSASTFSGTIAGMHDKTEQVDLGGFAYSTKETATWAEAANNTSGTLTIVDGSKTAAITLAGSYVTSNFVLSSDGNGGTIVVDPTTPTPTPTPVPTPVPTPTPTPNTTTSGSVVSSGQTLTISSGSVISGTSVRSGGTLEVNSSGTATGSVLSGGGEGVQSGGVDSGATISNGGYLNVHNGGVATGTSILKGGNETVLTGGLATSAAVSSGGALSVSSGGTVSGTTVLSGGVLTVYSLGASSATILAGGAEVVGAGATDVNAIVSAGGNLTVHSAGLAAGAVIEAGGALNVSSGGTASGTTVLSGGHETILKGGVLNGATVVSGGALVVSSGATLEAGLVLSGGTATVMGAVASGTTVTFATSGGELVLASASTFSGSIVGMQDSSERVDLGGFAYSTTETVTWTEAANNTSGTLSIVDGSKTAHLTLAGSYVTNNFALSSDGSGGTIVVDPPVSTASTRSDPNLASFVQAMASFGANNRMAAIASHDAASATQLLSAAILTPGSTSSSAHR